jgi:ferredoxin--NADP+ reductase
VRFGVAPDHQKIKAVIRVYERIAASQNLRFLGNVQVGNNLSVEELRRHYDQIIYAVGSPTDRRLGIPGEDLEGSHTATEFVAWYNSHPDYIGRSFDLSHKSAAVVGVGNVAMDVTRILAKDLDELVQTDIAEYALEGLRKSQVEEVVILARRGPKQAAFSLNEIREIGSLKGVDLVVDPKEVELDEASKASGGKEGKQKVEYLTGKSQAGEGSQGRKVRLRFCVSPVEILGENGRVTAVKIERNELYPDETGYIRSRGTGEYEVLPVGLI